MCCVSIIMIGVDTRRCVRRASVEVSTFGDYSLEEVSYDWPTWVTCYLHPNGCLIEAVGLCSALVH